MLVIHVNDVEFDERVLLFYLVIFTVGIKVKRS